MKHVYNINAVVQETGVMANTLRAWERRYQLPMPKRSKGGQRQYSEGDVKTVKWLLARKQEGISIQLAVDLWNEIKAEGRNPLEEMTSDITYLSKISDKPSGQHSPEDYRQRWVRACLNFDESGAESAISEAFGLFDLQVVCLEIFQEALVEIGNLWYEGKASVQQEHFASGLAIRRINALIAANTEATREERVVIATPPLEEHVISSLILTLLLRQSGFHVVYLGANVPQEGLKIMLSIIDPALVVFSSMHTGSLPGLLEVANYMAQIGTPVAFGGRIFTEYEELRVKIPGRYLGNDLLESRRTIELMLETEAEKPIKMIVNADLKKGWKAFTKHRAKIETQVAELFEGADEVLEFQHRFAADNIEASLALGLDDSLLGELKWANQYVEHMELGSPTLKDYLERYLLISQQELDEAGVPVQRWLRSALTILQ